ncbi:MAG: response regulator [Lachnospiraceae bacterium]|nr:response regulator [Lachnospiraceae bacterium]
MSEWIAVVDDDETNLDIAEYIFQRNGMRAELLGSGAALLDFMKDNRPDLILLDIMMPKMDGFETLERLRELEKEQGREETPVIFLTSDEDQLSETKGLKLGAMDYIRKPLVPDILILRVQHITELVNLQRNLSLEVSRKTEELESLTLQVVQTLADAIDAKDTYTNGHSSRVASYAKSIAERFGYSKEKQERIYMMGLLHDVGKIGVPDYVINKPAKLTEEEYNRIKDHSVMGARILKNIRKMPELPVGARWHHERYDGKGYPDGLAGGSIPEEARIICVADAYDAMTSFRSYRRPLEQDAVRRELLRGKGTQFDPVFADIMIEMMDEDANYRMHE